jgi:hypothetical protein
VGPLETKKTDLDFLTQLWLPILLSGIGVWVASAFAWMAIGNHKRDRDAIPNEQELVDTVARPNFRPGNYGFPDFCQHDNLPREARMNALKALDDKHPQGLLRVWGPTNMGANMLFTFLFYLVTSAVLAYLGWADFPHGAPSATIPGGGSVTGPSFYGTHEPGHRAAGVHR